MPATTFEAHISETVTQIGVDNGILFDTKLAYLSTAAGFATATARQSVIHYDNSDWVRKAGTITPNGGTTINGPTGFYYERQITNGINLSWFGVDMTGTTDASSLVQTACNLGGVINFSGTIRLNTGITLPSNCMLRGNKTANLIIGTGVNFVFSAVGKTNIEVSGFTAVRASGNTGDPLLLHIQQCSNVTYTNNYTTGVLGLQTYRPAYAGFTAVGLCADVTASFNTIKSVGGGPYGGAISLNYVDHATIIGNVIDGALHGIQWWGGDGNYLNGENNAAGTNTKWAKNIIISDNKIANISGGGIWGSMGENVTVTGNTVIGCGDVGMDFEATVNGIAQGNTVANCTNAALSVFYGSRNIDFTSNQINQRAVDGAGFHCYGNVASSKIKIMGGTITCLSTTIDAILTEDNLLTDFTLGGGLIISSRGRSIKLQRTNNFNLTNTTIQCEVFNVDGGVRPHAIYVQGGDNINIGPGVNFVYTGSGAAGAIFLSDGGTGRPISNARIEAIKAPGFSLGIKNDQFEGGGTTNKFFNNQVEALDITAGSVTLENNRNAAGVAVDSYLKQFARVVSGITGGANGYAPILTLPASSSNTYDYARLSVMMGGWTSVQRKVFILDASNRDAFSVNYKVETDIGGVTSNNLVAYQNADNSITFYVSCGTFTKISVTYLSLVQSSGVSSLVFTATVPTGTKVYDTSVTGPTDNTKAVAYSSLSQVRALTLAPNGPLQITDNGGAIYIYDATDTTSADDTGSILVTAGGQRLKNISTGLMFNALSFGAKGDGTTDDTAALQRAINRVCKSNNPSAFSTNSPSKTSNALYIPHGYYKVTDELLIPGSCTILMEQATSYGGTRIQQQTANKHLFHIRADTDGTSSGVRFIGGILRGGVGVTNPDIALIYGGSGTGDANNNSTYIENMWGGSPETHFVNIKRGDDIKIINCTWDVSGAKGLKFGDSANTVTNLIVSGCTFFDIRVGAIDLVNVDKAQITNNRVYWNQVNRIPYFINASGAAKFINSLIAHNITEGVDQFFLTTVAHDNLTFDSNIITKAKGKTLEFGGGGVNTRIFVRGNKLDGDFSGTVGTNIEKSPLFIYGTGLNFSIITNNLLYNTSGSNLTVPLIVDATRITQSIIKDNIVLGYLSNIAFSQDPSKKLGLINTAGTVDWNTYTQDGIWQVAGATVGAAPNSPFSLGIANAGTLAVAVSIDTLTQIFTDYTGNQAYRHLNGLSTSAWSAWRLVITPATTGFTASRSLAQARALTSAPTGSILLTDNGGGTFVNDAADTTSVDNTGTVLVTAGGQRLKRKNLSGGINVQWFGADPIGAADSAAAFQKAIDFAKAQAGINGGTFRYPVLVPAGWYLINTTLNCTNANGLIIRGDGGSYINTGIIGCTSNADGSGQGIIFDMTGSSFAGVQNMTITADQAWGAIASKIAIQHALGKDAQGNQTGGLRVYDRDLFIHMPHTPTVNGGLGSIGILNCRSEESTFVNLAVHANTPMILTNRNDMANTGRSVVFTSPFALVMDNASGSMGVIKCDNVSLYSINKFCPALILNGTNNILFQGYMGREIVDTGTYQTAFELWQSNYNITVDATIESYQRAYVCTPGSVLSGPKLTLTVANQGLPATGRVEAVEITGARLINGFSNVTFGNGENEMSGRMMYYHAPIGGGDSPATGYIQNMVFSTFDWVNNINFISQNVLRQSSNNQYNTGQPFKQEGGYLVDLKRYPVALGSTVAGGGNTGGISIMRFTVADRTTYNASNAGYYHFKVSGQIHIGNTGSGGVCVADFDAKVLVTQAQNGARSAEVVDVLIQNVQATSPAYINITNIDLAVAFPGSISSLNCSCTYTGTSAGEQIRFLGQVSVMSEFAVNQSMILA